MCKHIKVNQIFLVLGSRKSSASQYIKLSPQWHFFITSLHTTISSKVLRLLFLKRKKMVTVKEGLNGVNTAIGNAKKDACVICYCTIWGISLHALAFFLARDSQGGSAGLQGVIGRLEECLASFSTAGTTDASWEIGPTLPAHEKICVTHQKSTELKIQFLLIIFYSLKRNSFTTQNVCDSAIHQRNC